MFSHFCYKVFLDVNCHIIYPSGLFVHLKLYLLKSTIEYINAKNCWSSTANESPFKVFRLTQLFIYKYQRKCCNPWPDPQGTEHKTLLV